MSGVSDEEIRPGYYQDKFGEWHKDRRKGPDRRAVRGAVEHDERRQFLRRKVDRELHEREHKQMIREALDEFAAEHEEPKHS